MYFERVSRVAGPGFGPWVPMVMVHGDLMVMWVKMEDLGDHRC